MTTEEFIESVTGVLEEKCGRAYEEPFDAFRDSEEGDELLMRAFSELRPDVEHREAVVEATASRIAVRLGLKPLPPDEDILDLDDD